MQHTCEHDARKLITPQLVFHFQTGELYNKYMNQYNLHLFTYDRYTCTSCLSPLPINISYLNYMQGYHGYSVDNVCDVTEAIFVAKS